MSETTELVGRVMPTYKGIYDYHQTYKKLDIVEVFGMGMLGIAKKDVPSFQTSQYLNYNEYFQFLTGQDRNYQPTLSSDGILI